jgi:regulator of protease activity HflC (stomatin/prohibitin superfamily)
MLFIKYLLLTLAIALFTAAAFSVFRWLIPWLRYSIRAGRGESSTAPATPDRRTLIRLALAAFVPLLISLSIVVVPSGWAGVRISQISGTLPGTLYPGVHFIPPLVDRVAIYDVRDRMYATRTAGESASRGEVLKVQSLEGLPLGLGIAVRYRLDARRLGYIHDNLPQPIDEQLVRPVIASVFREIAPTYTVREVFSAKRELVRVRAAAEIARKLAADGVTVKEVMLRDIELPPEYANGLEELLLKEQENDRMGVETDIQAKQVRIAELEAEAARVQQVKHAEGDAQVRVLQAKAESDAMKYTLPLKEKQIQQSRLEAEARKAAVIENAQAEAEAKVIDSRAEQQRQHLLAEAEATRIRLTSAADIERMRNEAVVLKTNPLLINKIVAERLSDKVQIMMVPSDGKFFFANDVLRSPFATRAAAQAAMQNDQNDDPKK